MTILVTGGAGFIGANLALSLETMGHDVRVIDNFCSGSRDNLHAFEGQITHGDILHIDEVFRHWHPEVIFHQAANTDTTVSDRRLMFETNVAGFESVLEYALRWSSRVVYASSAAVYGRGPIPMTEAQSPQPLNVYAESKLAADHLAAEYVKVHGMAIVGLRYFNVYGPGEHHKGKVASMIWQLARQVVDGKRPRVFMWGEQERDHIYVADVVRANLLAMECETSNVINVGTGRSVSFNEIIDRLNTFFGTCFKADYFPNSYGFFQDRTVSASTIAETTLGFQASYSLATGIQDYFEKVNVKEFV